MEPPATAAARLRQWGSQFENQLLLVLAVLAFFPLLFELGRNPVQFWDESRLALNAADVALHGHWLVPYYGSEPDHWNTKPPLLIWLQALDIKLFGFSTWALRLPTALAALATVFGVFRFGARVLRLPLGGFFGALVLLTCAGFVKLHVARTGDYDALLTLWETIGWACFFQYLENGRPRYLYWLAAALTAAVLTKSAAGLLGIPGLLLYALGQRKLLWLLRQPRLYAAAGLGAAVIIGYYVGREALDPGYWKAVQYNDLGGRYLENQGDASAWYYYLRSMQKTTFAPWLWAIGPALALGLWRATGIVRRAAWLLASFAGGWLVMVSASASRHDWYDAPLYPALALLVGLGLAIFYQDLMALYLPRLRRWPGRALQLALVLGVFFLPYQAIMEQIIGERHSNYGNGPDGYLGHYLAAVIQAQPQLKELTVLYEGNYNGMLGYYQIAYQAQGISLNNRPGSTARTLAPGSVVVVCNPDYRARLDSTFRLVPLHEESPCQTVLLLPRTK
jgi:4-amino-4-deoxy-L-arabinose transferase-like glycosyltransferase